MSQSQSIETLPELLQYLEGHQLTAAQAAGIISKATQTYYTGTGTTGTEVAKAFIQLLQQHPPPAELPLFFG